MDDDKQIINRILDIANLCYNRDIPACTDFLDLNRQTCFYRHINELPPVCHTMLGGYEEAERRIIMFYPYEGYGYSLPYTIIKIKAVNGKFADKLNHRDYLGALLNLGIVRDKVGDILVNEYEAYVFVVNSMAEYVCENLIRVKHTMVICSVVEHIDFDYVPRTIRIEGSVASLRLDALIALGFCMSRNHIISYISEGRTAVNGKIITSNGYSLKEGDIISVRGLGKIKYTGSLKSTRKGRLIVNIDKYI